MAKLGLLGAVAGLGQGLASVGKDMYERREKALDDARKTAELERQRAFTSGENQKNREATASNIAARTEAQASNTRALIEGRTAEGAANRASREGIAAQNRAAQRDLVKLRSTLERSNEDAAKRLADQLSADDVKSVQYGVPDAAGRAEVFIVTNSGQVKSTGKKVYRPKRDDTEDDDTKL